MARNTTEKKLEKTTRKLEKQIDYTRRVVENPDLCRPKKQPDPRRRLKVILSACAAVLVLALVLAFVPFRRSMTLTVSAQPVSNPSVGQEWTASVTAEDGTVLKDGDTVALTRGQPLTFSVALTEQDDVRTDTGSTAVTVTPTLWNLLTGVDAACGVDVTENGGRYRGNQARWTVTLSFKP